MSARNELRTLVDILSEDESEHLATLVRDTVAGERFWEVDAAVVYNEHVKGRYRQLGGAAPPANGDQPAAPGAGPPVPDAGIFAPIPIAKALDTAERISLPEPGELETSLGETLARRRTRRDFAKEPLPLGRLSTLLHHACGVTGTMAAYGYSRLPLRTFPSSGGLQAPELYLSAQAVDPLASGLYHYDPLRHELGLLRTGTFGSTLSSLALGQPWVASAAVVFVISGSYERLRWKYGERAYRFMCVDAGLVAQNLHLVAEALGLGACAIAGFADDAVERLLAIDGQDEMALLLVCSGPIGAGGPTRPPNVL